MNIYSMMLRAADGGGAGAGAGAASAGSASGAGAGAGAGAGDGAAAGSAQAGAGDAGALAAGAGAQAGSALPWKAPDFLPENLRADKVEDAFTKIAEDWKRQRETISKIPAAPKSAEDYKFEPSEKVKPFLAGDLAKDPVMAIAREQALAAGLPADTFQKFVGGLYEQMADKGLLQKPASPIGEARAYLGSQAEGLSDEQIGEKMRDTLKSVTTWADGLKANKTIDEAQHNALVALMDTAPGLRLVQTFQRESAKPGIQPGGQTGGTGPVTRADLQARIRDPRNDPDNHAQYDKDFAAETDRLYRQTIG